MSDSYYLIKVSDGFRQVSYHLASDLKQVKLFADKYGWEYGIVRTKVYGPLKVNGFDEIDFQMGQWIGHITD